MGKKAKEWVNKKVDQAGDAINDVAKAVGNTIVAVAKDPLPVIATIALTSVGVPAPIANAIVVAAKGGSPEDMARAALASSVPILGQQTATALGVSTAVGTAIANTGVQVALGVPLDKAITNTAISAAAQTTAPAIKAEVNSVLNSPALSTMVTNMAVAAEVGILKGSSTDQIGQSMTMSAIYSAPAVFKEMYNGAPADATGASAPKEAGIAAANDLPPPPPPTPDYLLNPSGMSFSIEPPPDPSPLETATAPVFANPDYSQEAISGIPTGININPVEPTPSPLETSLAPDSLIPDTSEYTQIPTSPLEAATETPDFNWTAPVDTDFKPDYSLASNVVPQTEGLTAPTVNLDGASDVGYTPVDYSPYEPTSSPIDSGLGLQLPDSPAIKSMGGGQGLTADTVNPATGETGSVGELGYTPDDASTVLGNPKSFINNPDVLGQPVMQTDPAYDPWFKFSGSTGIPQPTNTGSWTTTTKGASPFATNTGADIASAKTAQSYLSGSQSATPETQLAQLQQLYPSITPDLSKVLLDRGMLLQPSTSWGTSNDSAQDLNQAYANVLSPIEFANFGQQYARGGNVEMPKGHHPEFITGKTGHYAQGRGTGQSDDIPAVLHDGDYVIDADTVAAFGDGSSKAGAGALEQFRRSIPLSYRGGGRPIPAKIADGEYVLPSDFVTSLGKGSNKQGAKMLDAMREQIRAHKRSAPDTKIPPKARSPLQYMREAMKG